MVPPDARISRRGTWRRFADSEGAASHTRADEALAAHKSLGADAARTIPAAAAAHMILVGGRMILVVDHTILGAAVRTVVVEVVAHKMAFAAPDVHTMDIAAAGLETCWRETVRRDLDSL